MSESFSANRIPASARVLPFNGSKLAAEPARPLADMPVEISLEQARAVKGALGFLAALLEFYGELVVQETLAGTEAAPSKGADLQ